MESQRSNLDPRLGPLEPGDQFEQCEIRRLLGRGAHAFVYEAHHTLLNRPVAIKVFVNRKNQRENLQQLVQSESRLLSKLNHQRLVRVLDAGAIGGDLVYLVMELLEGRSLREVYRELGTLTPAEVLTVGAQIAQGIEAAHAEKIIHGDLKPESVFVLEGNEVKVLDLGIARFLAQVGHTNQREVPGGTLLYMAPEHLGGLGVTPRSDIFALGTILYEGLAGKPPALVSAARRRIETLGVRQLRELQASEPPPDLEELVPGLPRHVANVVHKMIAKQPADRPGSMREVAEALLHGARRVLEVTPVGDDLRPLWKPALSPSPRPVRESVRPRIESRVVLPSSDPTPPPSITSGLYPAHPPKSSRLVPIAVLGGVVAGLVAAVTITLENPVSEAVPSSTSTLTVAASPAPIVPSSIPSVVTSAPAPAISLSASAAPATPKQRTSAPGLPSSGLERD